MPYTASYRCLLEERATHTLTTPNERPHYPLAILTPPDIKRAWARYPFYEAPYVTYPLDTRALPVLAPHPTHALASPGGGYAMRLDVRRARALIAMLLLTPPCFLLTSAKRGWETQ